MHTDSISYNYPEIYSEIDSQTDNNKHSYSIIQFEFILILIIMIINIILISDISVFNMINSGGLLTLFTFFLNYDYLLDVILLYPMNLTIKMQIFLYLYRSS